jgi:Kdo2-lipid IVA lauroyltransferase/acyltransferase
MAETRLGQRLLHRVEGAGAMLMFGLFRALPLDAASALGGWLGRSIGRQLSVTRRARRNLRRALPEIGEAEATRIIAGMWDNLGRVIAEYPHLGKFRVYAEDGRIEMRGAEHIRAQSAPGKRAIFFSAHFGNWEVSSLPIIQAGLDAVEMYRAPNNPLVDQLINAARVAAGRELAAKGSGGARSMLAAMKAGRHIALLVDQKMNNGIAVPFFGRDAMTGPALATFALRFDCAVVPICVERAGGARFRITAEPPLEVPRSGDATADTLALMTAVNQVLERWIRERPDLWFWVHRRWPEERGLGEGS